MTVVGATDMTVFERIIECVCRRRQPAAGSRWHRSDGRLRRPPTQRHPGCHRNHRRPIVLPAAAAAGLLAG